MAKKTPTIVTIVADIGHDIQSKILATDMASELTHSANHLKRDKSI